MLTYIRNLLGSTRAAVRKFTKPVLALTCTAGLICTYLAPQASFAEYSQRDYLVQKQAEKIGDKDWLKSAMVESAPKKMSSGDAVRKNMLIAQQVSNICQTPFGACYLPGYAPAGTQCWCATPQGPVGGIVR